MGRYSKWTSNIEHMLFQEIQSVNYIIIIIYLFIRALCRTYCCTFTKNCALQPPSPEQSKGDKGKIKVIFTFLGETKEEHWDETRYTNGKKNQLLIY